MQARFQRDFGASVLVTLSTPLMPYRFDLECLSAGPFVVKADAAAIEQALFNLLDNAVKYSREDVPWARVVLDEKDGWVDLTVEDRGVGIPEKEQDRIFEKFYRCGDALTRKVRGSGLGLTLVRQIVDAHGGEVRVASRVGEGSRFTIRLPLHRPPHPSAEQGVMPKYFPHVNLSSLG